MNKPYRDGTTLDQILQDGWSRGFHPSQTIEEAAAMGFPVSDEDVSIAWHNFQTEMEAYFERNPPDGNCVDIDPNDPWNRSAKGGWFE